MSSMNLGAGYEQELLDFISFNGLDRISHAVNAVGNVHDLCMTNVRADSEGVVAYLDVPVGKRYPPFFSNGLFSVYH